MVSFFVIPVSPREKGSTSYLGGTPHRMCQSRVSMTLLPTATHIDIAVAMALWILADHSQQGVVARMTTRVETSFFSASCRFIG